ncbi:MAG: small ribosomal subunit Rsm22 family protein [Treponema sp.]|jgi:ribosomal protein RSM22 (predicted rRNA methylase)|nr:small ribosomal subunit Rsm22 family protein [Treponema sp.]
MDDTKTSLYFLQRNLFLELSKDLQNEFQNVLQVIDITFPLSAKHRTGLPRDVAELSRQLTSGRSDRVDGYLGKAASRSAYLRYFLPWNVFRLLRLLPSLNIDLHDGDVICDLGSGPLTFAIALWISRPDLRKLNLEIRCVDRTAPVLEAGKKLFYAIAGVSSSWKIKTIRGSLGTEIFGEPAALVTAINVYNELFWDDRNDLGKIVKKEKNYLLSLVKKSGSVLVVEPGIPRSGEFISQLRESLLSSAAIIAPCPHREKCPFPGGKRGTKWCHFSFDTNDAPSRLHSLSKASGLPKEKAVLSFMYAKINSQKDEVVQEKKLQEAVLKARIISDAIVLGGNTTKQSGIKSDVQYGRYACSAQGMILIAGKKQSIEHIPSGTLIDIKTQSKRTDVKTGAPLFEIL